jgi:hypothetical protein
MIPLAAWLKSQVQAADVGEHREVGRAPVSAIEEPLDSMVRDDAENQDNPMVSRILELEAALRVALSDRESDQLSYRDRENELTQRLENEAASNLAKIFEDALTFHLLRLETSLADVLVPFFTETVRRKAAEDLTVLVRRSLVNASATVLELKAPEPLHASLGSALSEIGLSVRMVPSSYIEISFDNHKSYFEELSNEWIKLIETINQQ